MAAVLSACSGGGGSLPATTGQNPSVAQDQEYVRVTTFSARNAMTGELVHILPPPAVVAADAARSIERAGATTTNNLLYHGGPVQTQPHLYVVFWGKSWNNGGDPYGVAAQLIGFYSVIGGSGWLNSVTQYTQSDGQHVANAGAIFTNSISSWYVDTGSSPPRRPTQSQMAAEAARAAAQFNDYSPNASYVVAMPTGIHPSGFGSQYCAYHSTTTANGHTISWTNLPYMPDAGGACGANSVPGGTILDGVTIVGGHEQAETETDPQPNTGWLDSSGNENGDKCAWTNLEKNPNAGNYPTQPLWSNATSSCVQSS
jgi:serine protease